MRNAEATEILSQLTQVANLRVASAADPALRRRVVAVKSFQHRRFSHTYGDLLSAPGHAAAARFFLDELYGPKDFTERDAQFARVVPALVRLFPHDVIVTVQALARLHALSEDLDLSMARALAGNDELNSRRYGTAWQLVGRAPDRAQQIELMLSIGQALIRFTRNPLLRHSLRLMRHPARASGLGALQNFLESGFETFKSLPDPHWFLSQVSERERNLATCLFDWDSVGEPPTVLQPISVLI